MSFKLRTHGGLANRLQAIISHRFVHNDLIVEWRSDSQVAGSRFEDVFLPIDGVTFVEMPEGILNTSTEGVDACTHQPLRQDSAQWLEGYRDLKLRPEYCDEVLGALEQPYAAIHVRRTDFTPLACSQNHYFADEQFLAWCKNAVVGDLPIYVATDNGTTQRRLVRELKAMGRTPVIRREIAEHDEQDKHDHRNTSLADAAIDLFVCARATQFLGTEGSSFSAHAQMLKRICGWWT